MDLSRYLLLWLCMAVPVVQDVRAWPVGFVCDGHTRKEMNKAQELEAAMNDCSGSASLPFPILLPCVKIHPASWERKTLQEKWDDVQSALKTLLEGVRSAKGETQPECRSVLLEHLEHSVYNHLLILTQLPIVGEGTQRRGVHLNTTCHHRHTQDLWQLLGHYNTLLRGKLEWLMGDLSDRCGGDS